MVIMGTSVYKFLNLYYYAAIVVGILNLYISYQNDHAFSETLNKSTNIATWVNVLLVLVILLAGFYVIFLVYRRAIPKFNLIFPIFNIFVSVALFFLNFLLYTLYGFYNYLNIMDFISQYNYTIYVIYIFLPVISLIKLQK